MGTQSIFMVPPQQHLVCFLNADQNIKLDDVKNMSKTYFDRYFLLLNNLFKFSFMVSQSRLEVNGFRNLNPQSPAYILLFFVICILKI